MRAAAAGVRGEPPGVQAAAADVQEEPRGLGLQLQVCEVSPERARVGRGAM